MEFRVWGWGVRKGRGMVEQELVGGRYEREMRNEMELKENELLRYKCWKGEACVWNDQGQR